jgi:hypothetical protein
MKRIMTVMVAALLLSAGAAQGKDPVKKNATTLLAELHAAASCPSTDGAYRVWCIPADGWAKGTPAAISDGTRGLLGLTIALSKKGAAKDEMVSDVSLSVLAIKADKGKVLAKITSIKPTSDDETKMVAEAVAELAVLYKGKSDKAQVSKDLADYVGQLAAAASYPVTKGKTGWTFSGESDAAELRQVGDYWIAVETPPADDGIFVSIFTDKYAAK